MHLAAMSGQAAIIQQLAAAGADVNVLDFQRNNPLHTALLHCRAEGVRALLAAGARPSVRCFEQQGPLPPAAAADALLELLRALLSNAAAADVGNKQKQEAFQLAASGDRLLLQGLVGKERGSKSAQRDLLTPLHVAASTGMGVALNLLICAGKLPQKAVRGSGVLSTSGSYHWATP